MINNNIITINRGDTFIFPLYINNGSNISPNNLELTDKMTLYVGVMEPNQPFENAIIKKRYVKDDEKEIGDLEGFLVNSGDRNIPYRVQRDPYINSSDSDFFSVRGFGKILIKFFPNDTINLTPGKYYIEMKLLDSSTDPETVVTVSPKRLFYIID